MNIKRVMKIKEGIKEEKAREVREIDLYIDHLKKAIREVEEKAEEINKLIKDSFSEGLIFKYRALLSKREELLKKISQMEALREEKKKGLKNAYRDLKALEILKKNWDSNNRVRGIRVEVQNLGFFHLIKGWRKNA